MRSDERIRLYWLIEAFWIICVILIFRSVNDRRTAAMMASAGFILIPSGILIVDWLFKGRFKWLLWIGHLQFLLLFAFPIVVLNFFPEIVSGMELPVTGAQLHKYSNISYSLMILLALIEQRLEKTKAAQ